MNNSIILTHSELMTAAREDLNGNWGIAIGLYLIYFLIAMVAGVVPFASLLIAGPFTLGVVTFFLDITRNGNADIGRLFDGFNNFGNALLAYIIISIAVFVVFCYL